MTEKVAFLDVDTQVDFVEPGGKLYAPGAEAIKENLARLIQHARERGVPLVSCVDAHGEDDPEFAQYPPHCIRGTDGQRKIAESATGEMAFVPSQTAADLPDPTARHVVLEKQTTDVFTNANAEQVLGATGARTVVVFGVVTEVCVRQAVEGLLERGYSVRVVEDAIWPLNADDGEQALKTMADRGVERVTTAEVLGAGAVSGS